MLVHLDSVDVWARHDVLHFFPTSAAERFVPGLEHGSTKRSPSTLMLG